MPLYYDEYSNIPIDWPMIYVGWCGFADRKLSGEQVVSFALEQIGGGMPEQDEVAALLANTNPQDWQTIDRYLEQIVGGEQFDRTLAIRKWRLGELNNLLRQLPRTGKVYQYPEDEWEDMYDDFMYLAQRYDELPDSETMRLTGSDSVEEMLAHQKVWAERETISLREETGAAK